MFNCAIRRRNPTPPRLSQRLMARPEHLTDAELEVLSRRIKTRERALRELIARQRDAMESVPPEGEGPGDEADRAQERERQSVDGGLLDRYLAELAEIAAAQERVAAGTYGRCVECREPIGGARLGAQPTAERCVDCQARRERLAAAALR